MCSRWFLSHCYLSLEGSWTRFLSANLLVELVARPFMPLPFLPNSTGGHCAWEEPVGAVVSHRASLLRPQGGPPPTQFGTGRTPGGTPKLVHLKPFTKIFLEMDRTSGSTPPPNSDPRLTSQRRSV